MELSSTFISDDNPNKVINVAFFNIPFSLMYFFSLFPSLVFLGLFLKYSFLNF